MYLIVDNIGASDVGLTQNASYFQQDESTGSLPITYLHIYECDKFSVLIDIIYFFWRM